MNKRVELLRIINNIVIVFCLQTVSILILGGSISKDLMLGSVSVISFVLLSEIIQYFVRNLILYVVCHLGAVYLCHELSLMLSVNVQDQYTMLMNIFRFFMMIVMVLIAVYVRVRGSSAFYPALSEAIFFIALMIYCYVADRKDGLFIVFLCEMIWAVLAVIYYNALQIIDAMAPYKNNSSVPYEAVLRNNGKMLGVSVGIVIISMFICSLFDYGKEIIEALRFVVYHFFRWLYGLFTFKEEPEYDSLSEKINDGKMESLLPEGYEDDSLLHTIWQVLFWVIAAAVTIAIVVLLVKAAMEFYKRFNQSRIGIRDRLLRDKVEYLKPLSLEERDGRSSRRAVGLRERFTNEGKVRLIFKKFIQSGSGYKDIQQSQTPSELEATSNGHISKAYKIYEKARYSSHSISSEDIRSIREATKK